MAKNLSGLDPHQKRFLECFRQLTYRHQSWQVWTDFVTMAACSLASPFDPTQEREKKYIEIINRYEVKEQYVFPQLYACVVDGLENNPEQDFLGDLFMQLELGSHWKGQFFTPYSVCQLMAGIQMGGLVEKVDLQNTVHVNDPACGAGALLMAFANEALRMGVNYQQHVVFVAQDIDHTAAMMCYIQLSLLGCPGYVIVGDTLAHPATETLSSNTEVWYTPMYYVDSWKWQSLFRDVQAHGVDEQVVHQVLENDQIRSVQSLVAADLNDSLVQQLTFF